MSSAQEITEEAYKKVDQENREFLEGKLDKLNKLYEQHPEKVDSIWQEMQQAQEEYARRNREAAIKFVATPDGLMRLYWVRLGLSKDSLRAILEGLPPKKLESPYGKSLQQHIAWTQIEEGMTYEDFTAVDAEGNTFRLSDVIGEYANTFLLYGGLGCIREKGRTFLRELCEEICDEGFHIVVFNSCADVKELKDLKDTYGLDFVFVSDFDNDHSEMKIRYGAQATPTCYLINRAGVVTLKSTGLPSREKLIEKLR